jgi:hypothetical protein
MALPSMASPPAPFGVLALGFGRLAASLVPRAENTNGSRQEFIESRSRVLVDFVESCRDLMNEAEPPGWDGEGGLGVTSEAWAKAVAMLAVVMFMAPDLGVPVAAPCGDGSVHLRWALQDGRWALVEAYPSSEEYVMTFVDKAGARRVERTAYVGDAGAMFRDWSGD